MTRDEAAEKCLECMKGECVAISMANARGTVDAFVALGMLKLDGPPTVWVRAKKAIGDRIREVGANFPDTEAEMIMERLSSAGLKIIDK